MHRDHTEDHTDAFDWNEMYTGTVADAHPPDPQVVASIEALPPGRALDVGCGGGALLVALARRGWQVSGVDIAPKAIEAARAVLRDAGVEGSLHVANAASWSPPQAYDLVVSTFALPVRRDERRGVYRMIRGALRPGGTVLLIDFDASMPEPPGFSVYDALPLDELVEAFDGFEIERAEIVDTPPHDHDGTGAHAGERWTAALLHARKPR